MIETKYFQPWLNVSWVQKNEDIPKNFVYICYCGSYYKCIQNFWVSLYARLWWFHYFTPLLTVLTELNNRGKAVTLTKQHTIKMKFPLLYKKPCNIEITLLPFSHFRLYIIKLYITYYTLSGLKIGLIKHELS